MQVMIVLFRHEPLVSHYHHSSRAVFQFVRSIRRHGRLWRVCVGLLMLSFVLGSSQQCTPVCRNPEHSETRMVTQPSLEAAHIWPIETPLPDPTSAHATCLSMCNYSVVGGSILLLMSWISRNRVADLPANLLQPWLSSPLLPPPINAWIMPLDGTRLRRRLDVPA